MEKVSSRPRGRFFLDQVFNITGIGTVVSGHFLEGYCLINDHLIINVAGYPTHATVTSVGRGGLPNSDGLVLYGLGLGFQEKAFENFAREKRIAPQTVEKYSPDVTLSEGGIGKFSESDDKDVGDGKTE